MPVHRLTLNRLRDHEHARVPGARAREEERRAAAHAAQRGRHELGQLAGRDFLVLLHLLVRGFHEVVAAGHVAGLRHALDGVRDLLGEHAGQVGLETQNEFIW